MIDTTDGSMARTATQERGETVMRNDAGWNRDSDEQAETGRRAGGRGGWASSLTALLLVAALAACTNPLDVENPNKLTEEDVNSPAAMSSVVNGAQSAVTRGLQSIGGPYSTATDEITWIGSRDAWQQLDFGRVDDPVNEFTDFAFPFVAEARFMADRAISQGELFQSEGTLTSTSLLARAYLYGAIIYTSIAEQFDNFVLPEEPDVAVPPVGEENMGQLFDTAIAHATSGLDLVESGSEMAARLLAVRARAHHSKAVWEKLNPPGSTPADPLVASVEARDDALAALAAAPDADWRYQLTFDGIAAILVPDLSFADQVNERGELQVGPEYVDVDPANEADITAVTIQDPIDEIQDPVVTWKIAEFHDDDTFSEHPRYQQNDSFSPMTVTSAREMQLILAEDELATNGATQEFEDRINAVRSLDGLSDYTGQIPAEDILVHERRVNLMFMFRRLNDMYRFGIQDPQWQSTAPAFQSPGTMLPITITEIRSNPNISG